MSVGVWTTALISTEVYCRVWRQNAWMWHLQDGSTSRLTAVSSSAFRVNVTWNPCSWLMVLDNGWEWAFVEHYDVIIMYDHVLVGNSCFNVVSDGYKMLLLQHFTQWGSWEKFVLIGTRANHSLISSSLSPGRCWCQEVCFSRIQSSSETHPVCFGVYLTQTGLDCFGQYLEYKTPSAQPFKMFQSRAIHHLNSYLHLKHTFSRREPLGQGLFLKFV